MFQNQKIYKKIIWKPTEIFTNDLLALYPNKQGLESHVFEVKLGENVTKWWVDFWVLLRNPNYQVDS